MSGHEVVVDALLLAAFTVGKVDDATSAPRISRKFLSLLKALYTWGLSMTSESKTMYTCRLLRATYSHSGNAVLPPWSFVPRQFQTPSSGHGATIPAYVNESPFFMPSVIEERNGRVAQLVAHRGVHVDRHVASRTGVSYLTGLPSLILGSSGRDW